MQIVLPVAGLGTRVRPHTYVRPKPLLSLAGKPVLGHLLDYLLPLEPSSVILVVGENARPIQRYVTSHYSANFEFRVQRELKGQSHAIAMAADVISEPVLVVFGDTLFEAPLQRLTDSSVDGSIVVHPVQDPARFGVVALKDGRIARLVEKPEPGTAPSKLAVIGVYMLNDYRGLLSAIDAQLSSGEALKGEFFLADALQRMIDNGANIRPVTATGWWDTGTIDAILETHRHLVEYNRARPEYTPISAVIEPCHIHPTAKLERCAVGPYVTIGAHTTIVDSVISDSIVGDRATVSGQCIRHSIIGDQAIVHGMPLSYNVSDHASISYVPQSGAGL